MYEMEICNWEALLGNCCNFVVVSKVVGIFVLAFIMINKYEQTQIYSTAVILSASSVTQRYVLQLTLVVLCFVLTVVLVA